MIDTALDVIRKRYDKRHNPVAGDTVCVICAGNGNIYTASNEYIKDENSSENIHAEIIALKKMQEEGITQIKALTVFNACTATPLLPCNDCISYILSLNPENYHALIVTPNGNIFITDVGRFAAGTDYSRVRSSQSPYSVYTDIPDHSRGASLYINPSGGFGPAMNNPANRPVSRPAYPQVSMPQPAMRVYGPGPAKQAADSPALHANQNGVNNLLKSKLTTLFQDGPDDE